VARTRRLRWSTFALVAAAYVLSFFHRIAPAAIAGELRAAFDASAAALGALAATYFVVYTLMQVPTGVLVDTLGPRRVVTAGGFLAAAGSIAFGLAPALPVAALGRTLVGLGVSVTFISLLKLVAAWFREREFATVTGLAMLLGNLGAVLSASPLAWAVGVTSWRNVFVAVGLFSAAGAAIAWFVVRDRPEEAGLPSMRALEGRPPDAPHRGRWQDAVRVVAGNRATWPGFAVNMGIGGTFLAFAGLWAVPYLVEVQGLSRAAATWHTTAMLVAFALSSLGTGALSDRAGRRRPLVLGLGALYVLCWIPLLVSPRLPPAASVTLFAVMGLAAPGFTITWASAKEVNPPALSGTAMAVVNTGVFLGPTLYQPAVGWVLDRARAAAPAAAWRPALGVLAGAAMVGLAAGVLLRETYCRNVSDAGTRAAPNA
jgi:sugar phosphate permease